MLAIALSVLLAFECSLYVVAARHFFDATPMQCLVAALGGVLGLRAGINAVTWSFASALRTPWPELGFLRFARMLLIEYAAFVFCFVFLLPGERFWLGPDRLRPSPDRPPLLLVHGYGCSRGVWWWLRRRLEAAGWVVATISLEPVYTSIDNFVDPLARRIDEVCAATGSARVILIGHSMGGLVARAYLRRFGPRRVARLVTLGTPHRGSALARIGLGENGRQMEPGSDWLRALATTPPGVDTIVLYSPHDNYVMPQALLELPGVPQRRIDGVGHLSMLFSLRVAAALQAALQLPGSSGAGWKLRAQ